jgi:hypothetical protein
MKGQYNLKNIYIGKKVELRRGYNTTDKIWGVIEDVKVFDNIDELFSKINFNLIIPDEDDEARAKKMLMDFVDPHTKLIAFKVQKDYSIT